MKRLIQTLRSSFGAVRGPGLKSPEENWTVAGAGNIRGREWHEHERAGSTDRAADVSWVDGFFSGLSLGENYSFLRTDDDLANVIQWMDRHLLENPDEKVSLAAVQLAAQLLDPKRSNPW